MIIRPLTPGAYDDEEAAAHAYDLAALKYWGHDTILNFPVTFPFLSFLQIPSNIFCNIPYVWVWSTHAILIADIGIPRRAQGYGESVQGGIYWILKKVPQNRVIKQMIMINWSSIYRIVVLQEKQWVLKRCLKIQRCCEVLYIAITPIVETSSYSS